MLGHSKKTLLIVVLGALAASLLAGCAGTASSTDPDSAEGVAHLSFGRYPRSTLSLPTYVAQDQGIFSKNKLAVDSVDGKSVPEIVSTLIGGTTQIAGAAPQTVAAALRDGQKLVILPPTSRLDYNIMTRKELAIKDIRGLVGKKVGVTARGAATEAFVGTLLEQAGLSKDAVTYVAVGGASTMLPAFKQGQIDAMAASPSTRELALKNKLQFDVAIDSTRGDAGELGKWGWAGLMVTTAEFAEKSPVTLKRYCKAMSESIAFITAPSNRDAVIGNISTLLEVDRAAAGRVYDAEHGLWNSHLNKDDWSKNVRWAIGSNPSQTSFDAVTTPSCR